MTFPAGGPQGLLAFYQLPDPFDHETRTAIRPN
jgi:hypothetical protein